MHRTHASTRTMAMHFTSGNYCRYTKAPCRSWHVRSSISLYLYHCEERNILTWVVSQVQDESCHIISLALPQQGRHLARGTAGDVVHAQVLRRPLARVQQNVRLQPKFCHDTYTPCCRGVACVLLCSHSYHVHAHTDCRFTPILSS